MTLFDGITARIVETPRLSVGILERAGDDPATPPERTVILSRRNPVVGATVLLMAEGCANGLPLASRASRTDCRNK